MVSSVHRIKSAVLSTQLGVLFAIWVKGQNVWHKLHTFRI